MYIYIVTHPHVHSQYLFFLTKGSSNLTQVVAHVGLRLNVCFLIPLKIT